MYGNSPVLSPFLNAFKRVWTGTVICYSFIEGPQQRLSLKIRNLNQEFTLSVVL